MAGGTGKEPQGRPGDAGGPGVAVHDVTGPGAGTGPAGPGKVRSSRRQIGTERVRRPADLLLAVIAFLVVAVVLGAIRALPLGSTEAADDVSDRKSVV